MTRAEEYNALLQELEETPDRLNFTVARAKARTRRQRVRKWVGAPLISLSAACCAFVLLVNFSTPFAMACAKVPFFKELAEAVSFSSSLYAAVENEWVQPIDQTDLDNGYSVTIEYLIVDQKQLNIFFSLVGGEEADPRDSYSLRSDFFDEQGVELPFSVVTGDAHTDGELYQVLADFTSADNTMPGQVRMECVLEKHWDNRDKESMREVMGQFSFDLSFDPQFTVQATVVEVDQWMELDGQQILLKNVEIYPTHMRINLEDHPDNTAWLKDLEMYVQDEKGERFAQGGNWISGSGSPDSPFMQSFRMETTFFADSRNLTLYITEARWLNKENHTATIDFETGATTGLPMDTSLYQIEREGNDVHLRFFCAKKDELNYNTLFAVQEYRDPEGEIHQTMGYSIHDAHDDETMEWIEGWAEKTYVLKNYPWNTVELELNATHATKYESPVEIPIN